MPNASTNVALLHQPTVLAYLTYLFGDITAAPPKPQALGLNHKSCNKGSAGYSRTMYGNFLNSEPCKA